MKQSHRFLAEGARPRYSGDPQLPRSTVNSLIRIILHALAATCRNHSSRHATGHPTTTMASRATPRRPPRAFAIANVVLVLISIACTASSSTSEVAQHLRAAGHESRRLLQSQELVGGYACTLQGTWLTLERNKPGRHGSAVTRAALRAHSISFLRMPRACRHDGDKRRRSIWDP